MEKSYILFFLKYSSFSLKFRLNRFFCTDHVKFYNANLLELYEFLSLVKSSDSIYLCGFFVTWFVLFLRNSQNPIFENLFTKTKTFRLGNLSPTPPWCILVFGSWQPNWNLISNIEWVKKRKCRENETESHLNKVTN